MARQDQHNALIAHLPDLTQIIRGSVVRYHLTCGKKNCRCHKDKRFRHGPYWYLSVNQGKRTKMYLIPRHKVAVFQRAVKNYRHWWKTCLRIFKLNTKLALSKED